MSKAKKPMEWWTKFVKKSKGDKIVNEIISRLEEEENKGNSEGVKQIVEEIERAQGLDDEQRETLIKFGLITAKRAERKVGESVGGYIRTLRKEKGMTLKQMAEVTGISASYIQRIEKADRQSVSLPVMESIASALGVEFSTLYEISNQNSVAKKEDKDLYSVLLTTKISTTNGDILSKKEKDNLMQLIKEIVNCEWTEKSKPLEYAQLIGAIDKFKNEK